MFNFVIIFSGDPKIAVIVAIIIRHIKCILRLSSEYGRSHWWQSQIAVLSLITTTLVANKNRSLWWPVFAICVQKKNYIPKYLGGREKGPCLRPWVAMLVIKNAQTTDRSYYTTNVTGKLIFLPTRNISYDTYVFFALFTNRRGEDVVCPSHSTCISKVGYKPAETDFFYRSSASFRGCFFFPRKLLHRVHPL